MFGRIHPQLGVVVTLLATFSGASCLLEDKQVGGAEPDPQQPDPCAEYFDEDEPQCLAACSIEPDPSDCRTAQITAVLCQVQLSCDDLRASIDAPTSGACADKVTARDAACSGG
jgi:hypothetical protein